MRTHLMAAAIGALVAASAIPVSAQQAAAPGPVGITPEQRAELSQLSPELRTKVESRMDGSQTVHGILETMLLNQISSEFASGRIVATDWGRGTMVVEGPNGTIRVFPFDVRTLAIRG